MTRTEMESRRQFAIGELVAGAKVAELAKRIGVARISVYRWKEIAERGESLASRKATGRPPKLSDFDIVCCKAIYRNGVQNGVKWTQSTFAQAIKDYGEYSPNHAGRLMHKWGLRPKRQRGSL